MPRNGYWIECIPVQEQSNREAEPASSPDQALYSATSESFPDIAEMAGSPDQAIENLRNRMKKLRSDYQQTGKLLPELDNPVRPPSRLRNVAGWISVYVEFKDKTGN